MTSARAVQAVIWGMPAANFELLRRAAATAQPPDTTFVDTSDTVYDNTIPYHLRFFELLEASCSASPGCSATG